MTGSKIKQLSGLKLVDELINLTRQLMRREVSYAILNHQAEVFSGKAQREKDKLYCHLLKLIDKLKKHKAEVLRQLGEKNKK